MVSAKPREPAVVVHRGGFANLSIRSFAVPCLPPFSFGTKTVTWPQAGWPAEDDDRAFIKMTVDSNWQRARMAPTPMLLATILWYHNLVEEEVKDDCTGSEGVTSTECCNGYSENSDYVPFPVPLC